MKAKYLYDDLRGWMEETKKLGELREVDGLSWQEEIGVATEFINRTDPAPAAVYDKIPGYPKGHRVLVNFFGGKRMNMTLIPDEPPKVELSNAFLGDFMGEPSPIRSWRRAHPRECSDGQ
jgi:4-hydroxy-3-polyprenylbenzoate decarboxylase